jgi:hypothetical protein
MHLCHTPFDGDMGVVPGDKVTVTNISCNKMKNPG